MARRESRLLGYTLWRRCSSTDEQLLKQLVWWWLVRHAMIAIGHHGTHVLLARQSLEIALGWAGWADSKAPIGGRSLKTESGGKSWLIPIAHLSSSKSHYQLWAGALRNHALEIKRFYRIQQSYFYWVCRDFNCRLLLLHDFSFALLVFSLLLIDVHYQTEFKGS